MQAAAGGQETGRRRRRGRGSGGWAQAAMRPGARRLGAGGGFAGRPQGREVAEGGVGEGGGVRRLEERRRVVVGHAAAGGLWARRESGSGCEKRDG